MGSIDELEIEEREKGYAAADQLGRFVNSISRSPKYFIEAVMREHRTLQQSMFRLFLSCIKEWADLPEGHYDGRNEYTVKMSRRIMEALRNNAHVPLI